MVERGCRWELCVRAFFWPLAALRERSRGPLVVWTVPNCVTCSSVPSAFRVLVLRVPPFLTATSVPGCPRTLRRATVRVLACTEHMVLCWARYVFVSLVEGGHCVRGGMDARSVLYVVRHFSCRRRVGSCAQHELHGRGGGFCGGCVRAAVGGCCNRPRPAELVPAADKRRGRPGLCYLVPRTHASALSLSMCFRSPPSSPPSPRTRRPHCCLARP